MENQKPLHLIIPIISAMCGMQFNNQNVAIPGLFGDAGIGKTANILKMCQDNNWNLLNIHYGLKPLEEISGLPDFGQIENINGINIKRTNWTLPDILGDTYELAKNGKPTIIFLDDFHTASPGNMALGYEMFTSKKLRGYPFPQNSAFILAANISGSKSLANPIPSPIINRIAQFKVTVDFDNWKMNFAIPNNINRKILAFLSNPKYKNYFQTEEIVNKPWCSARSWTNFSTLLNAIEVYQKNILNNIDLFYIASSFIDEQAALNFSKYYIFFSEINTIEIFNGTEEFIVPDDPQKKFVTILANIDEFINRYTNNTKENEKMKYLHILSNIFIEIAKTSSEISVMGLKEILLLENSLKLKGLYTKFEKSLMTLNPTIAKQLFNKVMDII